MLEFAARCPAAGVPLLTEYRPALEVLRYALLAHRSPTPTCCAPSAIAFRGRRPPAARKR